MPNKAIAPNPGSGAALPVIEPETRVVQPLQAIVELLSAPA